jgi:phosphoribosylanthranilate isomerase
MVKVKICGITSPSDAAVCAEQGADFIGTIVEIPSSPRSISQERSKEILSKLPASAKGITVLAGKSLDEIIRAAEFIRPAYIQLHGNESLEFVEKVEGEVSCGVVKAVQVKGDESIAEAVEFSKVCDAILLDTPAKGLGGSGLSHDWEISSQIVEAVRCQVFLAGGLNPENVAKAVSTVSPFCVDVSSGVERLPGQKDPEKVKRFIERAKSSS